MRESIRGYVDAVLEDVVGQDQLATVAQELESVGRFLVGSDDLRDVLSDPGVATHVRRSILEDLLSSQVSASSMSVVAHAITVGRATESMDDLTWIARRFSAARDGLVPLGEGLLGRSGATERLDGYATSVLEGVRADDLSDVEDDLFRFSRVVGGSDDLLGALTDRGTPAISRRALVVDLLSAKATPASTRLAAYATQVRRPRDYVELLAYLVERVAEESQRQVAEVRAPIDLTEDQERRLARALARIVGHEVDVRVVIDRSVLGGFVANIGDAVVDGSARHRLEQLRERLVLPEASVTT